MKQNKTFIYYEIKHNNTSQHINKKFKGESNYSETLKQDALS